MLARAAEPDRQFHRQLLQHLIQHHEIDYKHSFLLLYSMIMLDELRDNPDVVKQLCGQILRDYPLYNNTPIYIHYLYLIYVHGVTEMRSLLEEWLAAFHKIIWERVALLCTFYERQKKYVSS